MAEGGRLGHGPAVGWAGGLAGGRVAGGLRWSGERRAMAAPKPAAENSSSVAEERATPAATGKRERYLGSETTWGSEARGGRRVGSLGGERRQWRAEGGERPV